MSAWKTENMYFTHWGRATHIYVGKLTNIGSDNALSPGRRQAIIGTNAGILLIGSVGINFSEIFIEIHTFSFRKMHLKMSSAKLRPFCLGLNVLRWSLLKHTYSRLIVCNIYAWLANYVSTGDGKYIGTSIQMSHAVLMINLALMADESFTVSSQHFVRCLTFGI